MTANNDPGTSAKPGKQRKRDADADHNQRRKMMSAHLSEDLMLDFDRRSMPVREGDTVRVTRGDFAGHEGEILEVDHKRTIVEVDGATNRSADGSQVPRPIHPSNVVITDLHLTDPQRRAALERKGVEVEAPPEPEPEEDEEDEEDEADDLEDAEPAPEPAADDADEIDEETDAEEPEVEAEPETDEAPDAEDEADADEAPDADDGAEADAAEATDDTEETADEAPDDDATEEETR